MGFGVGGVSFTGHGAPMNPLMSDKDAEPAAFRGPAEGALETSLTT